MYGGRTGAHRVLVKKPGGRRLRGKARSKREDNIKMNLRKVGLDRCGSI
jgi:hypothetical protein